MTRRITRATIHGVTYNRVGWGRCDECGHAGRVTFYYPPSAPEVVAQHCLCAACIAARTGWRQHVPGTATGEST
jgi:hypothetical protein